MHRSIILTALLILLTTCSDKVADQRFADEVVAAFQLQENQYQMAIQHASMDSARESRGHGMGIRMWNMSLFEMSEVLSEIDRSGVDKELVAPVDELIRLTDIFVNEYSNADTSTQLIDIATKGDRVQRQKIAVRKLFDERGLVTDG